MTCTFIYGKPQLGYTANHLQNTRTRLNKNFRTPTVQRDTSQRLIIYVAPKVFKSLPTNVRNVHVLKLFQKKFVFYCVLYRYKYVYIIMYYTLNFSLNFILICRSTDAIYVIFVAKN